MSTLPPPALPLAGLTVLDLSRALAGPFCSMILADLGAEVIKVEPTPAGEMARTWGPFDEGESCYYLAVHRNKQSLAIDFRDPRGLDLLRELAARSDVVLENFKPGVMEAMDMACETLRAANPRLIFCSITGFGRGGPYESWPGVDQIAQGMSGLMSLTGHPDTGPVRVGIPVGDVVAGMWAALGVQAAVIQRHATGVGQRVETSLLAGLIGLLSVQGQRHLSLGDVPGVAGNDHPLICPYGVFEAQDGPFNLSAPTHEMWVKLCGLVGLPELPADPRFTDIAARMAHREELKALLNARFATRGKMEWTHDLVALGLPAGPILDLGQVFADPHVNAAGMVARFMHPRLGERRTLANPIRMEGLEGASVRTPPPALGEHTRAVLARFGLDPTRVDALVAAGVARVAAPPA